MACIGIRIYVQVRLLRATSRQLLRYRRGSIAAASQRPRERHGGNETTGGWMDGWTDEKAIENHDDEHRSHRQYPGDKYDADLSIFNHRQRTNLAIDDRLNDCRTVW